MLKKFLFYELAVIVNQYERLTAKRVGLSDEDVLCQFLTVSKNKAMSDLAKLTAEYVAKDPSKVERDGVLKRLAAARDGMKEWARAL